MKYEEVALEKIKPNEYNPNVMTKRVFDILVNNIKKEGAMLQPILVTSDYTIIDGENRWKASKKAGLKTIPAIVTETSEEEAKIKTIGFNKIRGEYEPELFSKLLEDLTNDFDYEEISNSTAVLMSDIKTMLGDVETELAKVDFTDMVEKMDVPQDKPILSIPEREEARKPSVDLTGKPKIVKSDFKDEPEEQTIEMKITCTLTELAVINKAIIKLRKNEEYDDLSQGGVLAKFLSNNIEGLNL